MAHDLWADGLPAMVTTAVPGPASVAASQRLAAAEAPGINTLYQGRPGIVWQQALGSNVLDVDGNRYLDLTSGFGVAAIGHRHPAVVAAIAEQSQRLLHGLGDVAAHPARIALAEALCELVPIPDARAYFAVSGTDAIEIALKTALLHQRAQRPGAQSPGAQSPGAQSPGAKRERILAFDPAYHGLTLGSLAVTSRPEFRDPFAGHLMPSLERLPFGCPRADLERVLQRGDVAAVVVEPIVGREGVVLPPAGWLAELAELARHHGALLIADEIFTGFARTGSWFAVDHEAVVPDLLCCGKALGGGLPIGVTLGSAELMAAWQSDGEARHTGTFVAHPLAMNAALAVLQVMREQRLAERARQLGERLAERLGPWSERFDDVVETRGRGLLWGVELSSAAAASRLVERARARGILMLAGGPAGRVAQVVPPLTIAEAQLYAALEIIEEALHT